eukprot:1879868-Rhodomonas_salina.3
MEINNEGDFEYPTVFTSKSKRGDSNSNSDHNFLPHDNNYWSVLVQGQAEKDCEENEDKLVRAKAESLESFKSHSMQYATIERHYIDAIEASKAEMVTFLALLSLTGRTTCRRQTICCSCKQGLCATLPRLSWPTTSPVPRRHVASAGNQLKPLVMFRQGAGNCVTATGVPIILLSPQSCQFPTCPPELALFKPDAFIINHKTKLL